MTLTEPAARSAESRTGPAGEIDDGLFARIMDFVIDDPGSAMPFSQRLARENGWSRYLAGRVIEEYKRFCYLAMTAGHAVTPSDAVDQAWHLHLLYTKSYWDDFCRGVLKRPLHHSPTRGGPDEGAKFGEAYERTLASYRLTFGAEPPSDIWPSVAARFANPGAWRRVDTASCWLVPKPRWRRLARVFGTDAA